MQQDIQSVTLEARSSSPRRNGASSLGTSSAIPLVNPMPPPVPFAYLAADSSQSLLQGTTVPEREARGIVALLLPPHQSTNRVCSAIHQGLFDGVREAGYMVVAIPGETLGQEAGRALFQQLAASGLAATVTLTIAGNTCEDWRKFLNTPESKRIARVALLAPHVDSTVILADEQSASMQVMQHLLSLGHRHFLQLTFPRAFERDIRQPAPRIACYERVLHEHGLDPVQHLLFMDVHPRWLHEDVWSGDPRPRDLADPLMEGLAHHLVAYLRDYPQITAVLAANDAIAVRVWHALQGAGIRVPEDISLVGFNDTGFIPDAQGNNRLTSVHVPLYTIGQRAAQCLMRRVEGLSHADEFIVLPTDLVLRSSVGLVKRPLLP